MRFMSRLLVPVVVVILAIHIVMLEISGRTFMAALFVVIFAAFVARFLRRRANGLPAQFLTLSCSNESDDTYRYCAEWAMIGMAIGVVILAGAFPYLGLPGIHAVNS